MQRIIRPEEALVARFPVRRIDPARSRSPALKRCSIYCDESSLEARYTAWGGLWLNADSERLIRSSYAAAISAKGARFDTEVKWGKATSKVWQPTYEAIVDGFFDSGARFNCIVVDRYNPGLNRGEDHELDFYKSLFWLLSKRVQPRTAYDVILDGRTDREADRLTTLRDVLNNAARRDHEHAEGRDCFLEVRSADSKEEPVIQIADLLLGAVCFHMNRKHERQNHSRTKHSLAKYIANRAGFKDSILGPTFPSKWPLNIWLWAPSR
jgi:hypothetical protein